MTTLSESKEEQTLLNCLRDPQNYDFSTTYDFDKLQELCSYHRIRPQLYEMLKNNPSLPSEFRSYLKSHREQWAFRNLAFLAAAQQINTAFKDSHIDLLFYKGGLLSQAIYQDFSLRESSDLDIIVSPENLKEVTLILTELGYSLCRDNNLWNKELFISSDSEIEWFHPDKQITLDLHWRPNHPRTGLNFSFEDCLQHSQKLEIQNYSYPIMTEAFSFLVLSCHRVKSPQRRLCHLLDLIRLSEKDTFNWQELAQLSQHFQLEKVIAKTLISIQSVKPTWQTSTEIIRILPCNWKQLEQKTEDLQPVINIPALSLTRVAQAIRFLLYSTSNHYSIRKKISSSTFVFFHPSVQVMRQVLLPNKLRYLYPLIIPMIYLRMALTKSR
ncbi:nucleotidyltransferase family protein [Lentisphaera profundi]|uniref:Nucleotidyltransferase family protein n=1 Tax=Lentisphaera profundi TaxID=1658616 RepID=A0ABY7VYH3_9BACT|nr:nucleotidyltransferase family protein [Lentisphaera profundi]WDE97841.1 nucleotidyltransferase family protein [Lentisphaera profundi]